MARSNRSTKKGTAASSSTKDRLETNLAERMAKLDLENKVQADELKAEGNTLFAAGNNLGALEKFAEAISKDGSNHVLYSNRSAANLNLLRTRDAVTDAEMCVTLSPQWAKGYSRLGAALLADKQARRSKDAYRKGLQLEPTNANLLQGLALAEPAVKEEEAKEAAEAEAAKAAEEAVAEASKEVEPVIGIDLGTTYSCVAVWGKDGVEILKDEDGARTVPSYVGWAANGERLIGHRAKASAAKNVKGTVFDAKRIIGQRFNDEAVRLESKALPFSIVEGDNKQPLIEVETRKGHTQKFAPEEISAMVLGKMKQIAEKNLGKPVRKAVITVPAYFNDSQRQATKNAGLIAGLDVLRIINEPTAAALAYGLDQAASSDRGSNILIFDLGGGTFDVSVLRIEEGVFEVKATGGDTRLGGEDFDAAFVEYLLTEFKNKQKLNITDPKDLRKLRQQAETAKRAMSSSTSAKVEICIDGEDYSMDVPRAKWENLNSRLFNQTLDTVKKVLKDAKIEPAEIDDIVLVGGSTRVPKIQELLSEFFGGRQLCRSINPDEAVAFGAAVQGAILAGVRHSACDALVLVDVTPLSLGVEVEGKQMSVIIPRNTAVPCTKKENYTTTVDYGHSLHCRIFEGERPNTSSNHLLGEFEIDGIERAKKGEPKIEVTFALDSNGILNVKAIDLKTGVKANCTINDACKGLSREEMDRMVAEAERFAKEDAELVRKVQLKSEIESMAFDIREVDKHVSEETLDWLADLELSECPLATLEARHKELERAL